MPMALPLGVILLVVAGNCVEAYSMNDFVSFTSTYCPGSYNCHQRNETLSFPYMCECHDDCLKHSSCCYDAPAYEKREMKRSLERSRCVLKTKMTVRCLDGWKDREIQELCDTASPWSFFRSKEPFLHLPVTSKVTNTTYPNYYCAICNRDAEHIKVWNYLFGCKYPSQSYIVGKKYSPSELKKILDTLAVKNCSDCSIGNGMMTTNPTYSDETQEWRISITTNKGKLFFSCRPSISAGLIGEPLHSCVEEIETCAENWNDKEVEDLCKSFKGSISIQRPLISYRNVFCAICNNVFNAHLCHRYPEIGVSEFYPYPLQFLYEVPDMKNKDLKLKCEADEDFYPNYCTKEKPKNILCQLSENHYGDFCIKRDHAPKSFFSDPGRNNQMDGENSTGDEIEVHKTVSSKSSNKIHHMNGTHGDTLLTRILETEKSSFLSWVTFSLISVSMACLLLHLAISVLSKELRSLPGRNRASLCLSLLLSYITFITGPFLETNTTACYVSASVMYFSWIASFCWMTVIGFDTWWCFEKTATDFHLAQGSGWFRFLLYSVSSWLTSAMALAVLIIIDQIQPEGIDKSLLPKLGREICWFGENESLQVFFVYPVITVVVIITILFVRTAWVIFKSSQGNGNVTKNCARRNLFKINLRLGVIMGIPWTTYITSWYFGTTFLEYIFVIMNSFQGTFIFFAFSCKREIWAGLLKKCQAALNNVRKNDIQQTTSTLGIQDEQL
ncbi:uncharacterized protein LOC135199786 [Macrobrachium nipponense]|uniref:uncharacterized protein LOC135199786 n=1 Tax=Macrobrachium nipponense TaxID=159736 RepID=UPI0030C7C672